MPAFKYPDTKWGEVEDVERMYRREKDAGLARKLNAIKLLMKGRAKKEVAEILDVSVATIGNWRDRWNREGKEGLKSKNKGRRSRVSDDMKADIREIVEVKREINGRTVTGYLIHGYLKKNTD